MGKMNLLVLGCACIFAAITQPAIGVPPHGQLQDTDTCLARVAACASGSASTQAAGSQDLLACVSGQGPGQRPSPSPASQPIPQPKREWIDELGSTPPLVPTSAPADTPAVPKKTASTARELDASTFPSSAAAAVLDSPRSAWGRGASLEFADDWQNQGTDGEYVAAATQTLTPRQLRAARFVYQRIQQEQQGQGSQQRLQRARRAESTVAKGAITGSTGTTTHEPSPSAQPNTHITFPPVVIDDDPGRISNPRCTLKDVLALACELPQFTRKNIVIVIEAADSLTGAGPASSANRLNLTTVQDASTASGWVAPGLQALASSDPARLSLRGTFSMATAEWILSHATWRFASLTLRGVTDTALTGEPFAAVPQLTSVTLADNALHTIEPSVLAALPSLNAVDLRNNSLASLDPALFQGTPNLTFIDLSSNLLETLPEELLRPIPRLRELRLSENHLSALSPRLLAGLSHLRILRAFKNQLTRIPDGLFRDTTRLQQLSLQRNAITSVSPAALQPLTDLSQLYLGNNRITTLSPDAFAALTSLETLDIANNALARLPEPLLHNLHSVVELRLADNGLTSLSPNAFQGLSALRLLWLSGNGLTSLPQPLLSNHSELVLLDISNNGITLLHPDFFAGTPALAVAYMNTNALQSLPATLFHPTKAIEWVDVSDNAITALPPDVVEGLSQLQELHLSNNRLATLPAQLFQSVHGLLILQARDNLITSLPPALLSNLTSLASVSFLNNRLADVPADLLFGSRRVTSIDLSHNHLTRFPPDLLRTQTRVSLLRLSHNRIPAFRTDTFRGITASLRVLSCDNNELTELQPFVLRGHTELHALDLSNNPLRRLPKDLLDTLSSLNTLRLHNTLLTSLPATFFNGAPGLGELDLSYVPHTRARVGSLAGDHVHHVPEPLLTITGTHLMSLPRLALSTLDLTNVVLTEDAAGVLADRFFLDTLRVGWAGLDDSSRILSSLCSSLRQGARHLHIRFSSITALTACTERHLKSLHLQNNPRLQHVAAGTLNQLNVSGCHSLHTLQASSVEILDISDTNVRFSALLCKALGTRMLFARNLRHPSFDDAALAQRLIETCLEQVQVVDVSQNAWLNNLNLIAHVGSQQTVLADPGSTTDLGAPSFWAENNQRLRQRNTAPVLTLDGSPVQCRFDLISLLARRGVAAPLTTEVGYTFRCGCAPRFRQQGERCVPDSLSTAQLAGIVVGAVFFGLALGPCAYAIYRARKRSRAYRAKLETENELQKRLIEEKDEEVLALKRAWEIGFDELHFVSRIDEGSPGTFGEVWRADWDTVQVAVKVLRQGIMLMDESTVAEFGNEVEFLQRTRHPHVVRFFGAGTTPYGSPFLVLELVAFGSLQALLRKELVEVLCNAPTAAAALLRPHTRDAADESTRDDADAAKPHGEDVMMNPEQQFGERAVWRLKLRLTRDVACGMAFIHSLGKLHRDLKSGNVLVSGNLRAKITDFGSIKQCFLPKQQQPESSQPTRDLQIVSTDFGVNETQSLSGSSSLLSSASMSMTAGVGTPLYMAPEALDGNCYDAAADVFSFSIVMWEIATQQRPDLVQQEYGDSFRGPLLPALHRLYQAGKRLSFAAQAEHAPSWFKDLCCRCWQLQPTDRPSFEDILTTINERASE